MINSKYALIRKINMLVNQLPRSILRYRSSGSDYVTTPPILANSLAKSGTYLLVQLLQELTCGLRFGSHISSWNTSIISKQRTEKEILKSLGRMVPNEIVPAHIFYTEKVKRYVERQNIVHYFISRDPRNIVLSEVDYLTNMAKWHVNHKLYKNTLINDEERIWASITGINPKNNDVIGLSFGERVSKYKGWLLGNNVCNINFENLMSVEKSEDEFSKIIDFYNERSEKKIDVEYGVNRMRKGLAPTRSHTFSGVEKRVWSERFSNELVELLNEQLGDMQSILYMEP